MVENLKDVSHTSVSDRMKKASDALILHLAESGADVALIQEPFRNPWRQDSFFGAMEFRLCTADLKDKKRTCILTKKEVNIFLLPNLSNADHVAAAIELISITSLSLKNAILGRQTGSSIKRH